MQWVVLFEINTRKQDLLAEILGENFQNVKHIILMHENMFSWSLMIIQIPVLILKCKIHFDVLPFYNYDKNKNEIDILQ